MHGGSELGTGIAKARSLLIDYDCKLAHFKQGAASFLKKTTFGLADTVGKVTSSVGKGA